MSSRRPVYIFVVILLAVVLSAPQLFVGSVLIYEGLSRRRWPLPSFPIGQRVAHNPIQRLPFWRDKLVRFSDFNTSSDGSIERSITLVDLETGVVEKLEPKLLTHEPQIAICVFDDRIFFVGKNEAYEWKDGRIEPSNMTNPGFDFSGRQQFIVNDTPTIVDRSRIAQNIKQLQQGRWKTIGTARLGECTIDGIPVDLANGTLQVYITKDSRNLFVHADDRMFYHRSLEIDPMTASALDPQNTRDANAGWSLVREQPATIFHGFGATNGLLIGGQPAALIFDGVPTGNTVGRLYRFDGSSWSEFASQPFPFGSLTFATATTRDGQRSYVASRTSYGETSLYLLNVTGFHATSGSANEKTHWDGYQSQLPSIFWFYEGILGTTTVLGFALGSLIWPLMRMFTKSDYSFGLQTVELASLGRRAAAKVFDLTLLIGSAVGVSWLLLYDFNWIDFFEALNLGASHPTVSTMSRAIVIVTFWLAMFEMSMLVSQARVGATPGKWLCGIRTLRTTLRPCGFARSLAREIVFFVDCCNFTCWTPGIVSIALTDRRQRLGDLVADTIVVTKRSLATIPGDPSSVDKVQ